MQGKGRRRHINCKNVQLSTSQRSAPAAMEDYGDYDADQDDQPQRRRARYKSPERQQQPEQQPEFMTILQQKNSESTSRNTRSTTFSIKFAPSIATAADVRIQMRLTIEELYRRLFDGRTPPTQVGMLVYPPNFDRPYPIPLRPLAQNNPAAIAEALVLVNERYEGDLNLFDGVTEFKFFAVWPLNKAGNNSNALAGRQL